MGYLKDYDCVQEDVTDREPGLGQGLGSGPGFRHSTSTSTTPSSSKNQPSQPLHPQQPSQSLLPQPRLSPLDQLLQGHHQMTSRY